MDNNLPEGAFSPSRRLNFIIAICAISISLASFYATYMQAESEAAQAKAMTYPLIQFTSSNFERESNSQVLTLELKNQGVGPALLKQVKFHYNDQSFDHIWQLLNNCCEEGYEAINKLAKDNGFEGLIEFAPITSEVNQVILPANETLTVFSLRRHQLNNVLWSQLDKARFKVETSVCYCSLLQQCYVSRGFENIIEVDNCDGFIGERKP